MLKPNATTYNIVQIRNVYQQKKHPKNQFFKAVSNADDLAKK